MAYPWRTYPMPVDVTPLGLMLVEQTFPIAMHLLAGATGTHALQVPCKCARPNLTVQHLALSYYLSDTRRSFKSGRPTTPRCRTSSIGSTSGMTTYPPPYTNGMPAKGTAEANYASDKPVEGVPAYGCPASAPQPPPAPQQQATPTIFYISRKDMRRQRKAARRAVLYAPPVATYVSGPIDGAAVFVAEPRGPVGEVFAFIGLAIALPFRIVNSALRAVF